MYTVRAYVKMCELVPAPTDGLAFVMHSSGAFVPVSYTQYNGFSKKCISKIGKYSARFSSHSFRRGGTT